MPPTEGGLPTAGKLRSIGSALTGGLEKLEELVRVYALVTFPTEFVRLAPRELGIVGELVL